MSRSTRARALIGAAGATLALGALPAPAQATVDSKHCLEPPYTATLVLHCACVAVAGVGQIVLPDSQWTCIDP